MREQILIVLNERESSKQRAAAALSEALALRRVSSSRLRPERRLTEIILERNPEAVILDYLLGDEGTALDVLGQLRESPIGLAIPVIIWTDDPSVSVAVDAMKLGAVDYLALDGTRNLDRLLRTIEIARTRSRAVARQSRQTQLKRRTPTSDPIAESAPMRKALLDGRVAIRQHSPVIVICGSSGSGRSTIAEYLHRQREYAGLFHEEPLELWDGTPEELFDGVKRRPPLLAGASTVVLEHAEFDEGGVFAASAHRKISRDSFSSSLLIVGTSETETAKLWNGLTGAPILSLPPLEERQHDLLPLLQRWSIEAREAGFGPRMAPGPATVNVILSLSWPRQLRELERCYQDALALVGDPHTTPDSFRVEPDSAEEEMGAPTADTSGIDERERRLLVALRQAKLRYERYSELEAAVPTRGAAERELRRASGNERVAAVRLGVGIPQLRAAIRIHTSTDTSVRTDGSSHKEHR